jgi:hypothetical protein
VVAAAKARLSWMVRTANRQAEIAADHPVKEIVDGENFPYLGRPRRLVLVKDTDEDVQPLGTGCSLWAASRAGWPRRS